MFEDHESGQAKTCCFEESAIGCVLFAISVAGTFLKSFDGLSMKGRAV